MPGHSSVAPAPCAPVPPRTPWSADAELDGDVIRLDAMLSLDPGPAREFRTFLSMELDEASATVLLGKLALALDDLRSSRQDLMPWPVPHA